MSTGQTPPNPTTFEELIPFETIERALNIGFMTAKANAGSLVRAAMTYREVSCAPGTRFVFLSPPPKVYYGVLERGG